MTLPVLYSFRRCPYAMRGRLALACAGITVELREILLKDKPQPMIDISPKGTVPVLQLPDGQVIGESIDVMHWALGQNDPDGWLQPEPILAAELIEQNDGAFKDALDRYKYHVRFPEHPPEHYRGQGEIFLQRLESLLAAREGRGLLTDGNSLADMAIFPFVRQFANTDMQWFETAPYPHVQGWLRRQMESELFARVMRKYELWQPGTDGLIVNW